MDIYNRYAHITINLVEDQTSYELIQVDLIQLNLSVDDLDLLGVDYVISTNDLEQMDSQECRFTLVFSEDEISQRIYKVSYFD